jgi:MYND finger
MNFDNSIKSTNFKKMNITTNICMSCGKSDGKTYKCAKCKDRFYCSVECQKKDWPVHKNYCVLNIKKPKYYGIIDMIFQKKSFSVFIKALAFLLLKDMLGVCEVSNSIFTKDKYLFNVKTQLISEVEFYEDSESINTHLNNRKEDKVMLFDFTSVTGCEKSNISVATLSIQDCEKDYNLARNSEGYNELKYPLTFILDTVNDIIETGNFIFQAGFKKDI